MSDFQAKHNDGDDDAYKNFTFIGESFILKLSLYLAFHDNTSWSVLQGG